MNSQENGRGKVSPELSEAQQLLKLLEGIVDGQDKGSQKRKRLLEYCRSRGVKESSMWARLALYRKQGPADVLLIVEQVSLFSHKQQRLRQRIVELIGKLPELAIEDFRALLGFREHFLERVEYVSDLLLYFFLEREKGLCRESHESSVYTTYFNHKLFRECNMINEIVADEAGIGALHSEYESWLIDQAFDEDAPL